ncbi:hypothetical protein ACAX43_11280 [Paraburkholderia sp. IW21]|uniref:hypothetical protein n=1 Tax=Paraburkholderia sp. IW21 TaxID=3242488 RepID=UPI00351FF6D9
MARGGWVYKLEPSEFAGSLLIQTINCLSGSKDLIYLLRALSFVAMPAPRFVEIDACRRFPRTVVDSALQANAWVA